jgi:hypothetical protein
LVRNGLEDGMGWLAVGVALVVQAGCLLAVGWYAPQASGAPPERFPAGVASSAVAIAFVAAGLVALHLGVRKVIAARRR